MSWPVTIHCPATEAQLAHLAVNFPRGAFHYFWICDECYEIGRLPRGVYSVRVADFYCF